MSTSRNGQEEHGHDDALAVRSTGADFEATFARFIAARQLWIPRCAATHQVLGYTARISPDQVHTEIEWVRASGAATLYSFTVYRRQYHPDFPVPYIVAQVELDEGPRLVSTVLIERESDLRIGMPLRATFDDAGRLIFMPSPATGALN